MPAKIFRPEQYTIVFEGPAGRIALSARPDHVLALFPHEAGNPRAVLQSLRRAFPGPGKEFIRHFPVFTDHDVANKGIHYLDFPRERALLPKTHFAVGVSDYDFQDPEREAPFEIPLGAPQSAHAISGRQRAELFANLKKSMLDGISRRFSSWRVKRMVVGLPPGASHPLSPFNLQRLFPGQSPQRVMARARGGWSEVDVPLLRYSSSVPLGTLRTHFLNEEGDDPRALVAEYLFDEPVFLSQAVRSLSAIAFHRNPRPGETDLDRMLGE